MSFLSTFRIRFADIFRRSQTHDEMQEELRAHLELRAEDLERSGMAREEAQRRAGIEFGAKLKYEDQIHEQLGSHFMETLLQDIRLSTRVLRKSPGFTIAAVLTLALAIGANAVVFGMLNAILLRPIHVPDAQSLYSIERGPDKSANVSYPDFLDLRDQTRAFDSIALYNITVAGLDTGDNVSQTYGYEVSGNYFDALRVQPYLGRFFHNVDEQGPNSAPYLVLSYPYWQSRFQADRGVVGRVVNVNKHPFTILGVAPPEFAGTLMFFFPDFWIPAVEHGMVTGNNILNDRGERDFIMSLGHLRPGVTPAQAIADLNSIGASLAKSYPKDDTQMTFTLARPGLAGDLLGPPARGFLTGLMLLAGLILLAACANLGGLFAARAADRSREVALRLALGSSRRRILRSVFTEAILVSLAGGLAGLLGSIALLRQLSLWHPIPAFPIQVPVSADGSVYLAALVLSITCAFLFGSVPVRQILRINPYEVVKAGSTGIIAGQTGRRISLRDILLVVQIAICAVLVTSSLVAVRGLLRSMHGSFGFNPQAVMLVDTDLNMAGYSGDRVPAMQNRMVNAMRAIPGVQFAAFIDKLPLGGGYRARDVFSDQTTDFKASNILTESVSYRISADYFHAAGTELLRGREISQHDDSNSPRVAVINEEFARKIFGSDSNAMGQHFKIDDGARIEVVGIVEDGKYNQLTEDQQPAMFLSYLQFPSSNTRLVVCSDRDPAQLASEMRASLRGLDHGLPFEIRAWNRELGLALFPARVASVALGVLGAMGAMLALTGIFGMAAYTVSRRLRELGIRMALGAQRLQVLQAALGRQLKLLLLGSAAGLLLGILSTRVLAHIVFQANPRDPLVLASVVLLMSLLGLMATWIPAQRALTVNPLILLREE